MLVLMKIGPRPPLALLGLLIIGSCVQSESPTLVGDPVAIAIPLSPAVLPSPADAGALPVDRIRVRATRVADGVVVGSEVTDVSPTASEWEIGLTVTATSNPVDVQVFIELLNTSAGSETVQFSGIAGPFAVSSGQTVEALDVDLVRGPLDNFYVTGVTIDSSPDSLYEGSTALVDASASTTSDVSPQIFLTSLDSASLSVSDSTVTGLLPGTGRVVASAGPPSDTVTIVVRPAPAAVMVTPDTSSVSGPGDQETFTATVIDARGDTLPTESVVWSTSTPSVLSSLGGGVFEAVATGTGRVEATSTSHPAVAGSATLVVGGAQQPGVDVSVSKSVNQSQPLAGSQVVFTVQATNPGTVAATDVEVFDSLPALFESPQHTVSTGALAGDTLWTIPSLAPGDTATWTTTSTIAAGGGGSAATNTAFLLRLAQSDTFPSNDTASVTVSVPLSPPPTVSISTPPDSSVFDPGDLVTFNGAASDPEDGDLSPSIQWVSSLDGVLGTGRIVTTDSLSTGVHQIVASATDSDGGLGADTITVTVALYTIPATLNVPLGSTASLPISLTEPAPTGGVTLSVTSDDPSITQPQAATVFIAAGSQSANAVLDGIAPGNTTVSVSSAQFGVVTSVVSVTSELNILAATIRFPDTFTEDITIQSESQGTPLAAPAGGIPVSFASRDAACVQAPGPATISAGLISTMATVQYGGSATVPCTTYLVASAPNAQADSVQVTVDPTPALIMSDRTVGSGLQEATSLSLGEALPAGDTVTITSSDPSVLLAPDPTTVGSDTLHLTGGTTFFTFYIQAVEGFTGAATLEATSPRYVSTQQTATVVAPGVRIRSVLSSMTTLGNNDIIWADIGPENGSGSLLDLQQIRAGGSPLTVNFISTNNAVATLVTSTETGDTVTAVIPVGDNNTPTTLAGGGVEVDPLSVGTSDIYVEAAGYVSVDTSTVTVSAPTISTSNRTLASGLQTGLSFALGAALPANDTVTITSSDPNVLLAPDATTMGADTLRVTGVATFFTVYVQALENFTGSATVEATAPGFTAGEATMTVVQPGVRIRSVPTSTTTLANNDVIWADVGPTNGAGSLTQVQDVRAGGQPLTVTFISTNDSVATLETSDEAGDTVTAEIQPSSQNTPTSLATGGVELDPMSAGSADVYVEAVGYISVDTTTVTVTAPGMTMANRTVGSGLQEFSAVSLGATLPTNDTIVIASSDPNILVAPNDGTTVGSDTLRLTGQTTSFTFYIQALEGFVGTATITSSAPGFTDGVATVTAVQPGVRIRSVLASSTTLSGNDIIWADVGPESGVGSLSELQPVRAGAAPLTVTFISSAGAVASLVTQTETNDTVTAQIIPNTSNTPTALSTGGVELDPLTAGTSDIYVEAPGYVSVDTSTINITAPTINMVNRTVGAGLQEFTSVSLGATLATGDTLTIVSSNPNVLLAPDGVTVGSSTLRIAGPLTAANFYIQAVEGFTGQATMTASAPGYTDGVSTATVVQPGIRVRSVVASYGAGDANDVIWADVGPENGNGGLLELQPIRAGVSPLDVTFTSSDPSAATLVTQTLTGGSVTAEILPGVSNTPTQLTLGGVELDPLAAGSTTISVTANGFLPAGSSQAVTINP